MKGKDLEDLASVMVALLIPGAPPEDLATLIETWSDGARDFHRQLLQRAPVETVLKVSRRVVTWRDVLTGAR